MRQHHSEKDGIQWGYVAVDQEEHGGHRQEADDAHIDPDQETDSDSTATHRGELSSARMRIPEWIVVGVAVGVFALAAFALLAAVLGVQSVLAALISLAVWFILQRLIHRRRSN